jgi:transcriptional regulator with XRE-family HTH domain
MHDSNYQPEPGDAARLGARLRSLRRQQHLSLQDVETASRHEFKASVLGAYERGDRAISVRRLQRLARIYHVPVDQKVPRGDEPSTPPPAGDAQVVDPATPTASPSHHDRPVTIDLAALDQLRGKPGELLARYLRTIEVQRGDYNGRMLTVRRHDLIAIAAILDCHPEQVLATLDSHRLRLTPDPFAAVT